MQSLKNFLNNQSIPIVISIMALFIAFGTQDTPCLSANVCSAGSDPEFQNDLSFKSGTINKATFSHDLSQDNQYFIGDSGSSGTSTIALITKDSSNQEKLLTVNGGVTVGQSSVSEPGTIRVQTSTSPVLQIYGSSGWEDVGGSPSNDIGQVTADTGSFTGVSLQDNLSILGGNGITTSITGDSLTIDSVNDIGTVAGDSGSFSSATPGDTFNIVGSGGISTSVSGDTITISSSSGGTPISAYFGLSANQTTNFQNGVPFNVEKYDSDNCFTLNYASVGSDITYTCADTRVFKVGVRYHFYDSSSYYWSQYIGVNLSNYPSAYQIELYNNVVVNQNNGGHDTGYVENFICLEQNNDLEFTFSSMPNGISMRGSSQLQRNNVQLTEDPGLTALAQSNGCTNGVID